MIKQFEQYINSDIDPYNEEDWQDKLDIKEGDIVICINDVLSRGRLKKGLDYEVIDLLYNRGFLTLRGVKGAWAKHLFIKQNDNDEQFEQYEFDPYDEEIWNDEISQDNDIKEGDAVICINNDNMNPRIMKPVVGEKYRVVEVLPNDMIKVRPLNDNKWKYTGKYKINRFKKTKDPFKNEHIHYLLDDYDDVPEENIEVVGLPSGEYSLLKRKDYEKYLTQYVNWSEKLKCYVYRDKDFNRIKIFLFSP